MPGTKVAKEYIEFSDSTKQYASFPSIGSIVIWAGDVSNLPEGYLLCDGQWIKNEGEYVNLYQKLNEINGLYDDHPVDGLLTGKPSGVDSHRLPTLCKRYALGTGDWSNQIQDSIYGGSNKLSDHHFKHNHKFNRASFVHEQYDSGSVSNGNGNHVRGKKDTTNVNTKGPSPDSNYTDSGTNEEFLPVYTVIKYIIKYK